MRTKVTFSMNKRFTFWSGKWWVLIIALQIWWTLTNLCCKSAAYSQNRNHLYLCNYIHCLMARHMQQEYRQGIDTGKPVIVWKSCFSCDCAYWCSRIGWRAGQEKLWHPTMWAQSYSVITGGKPVLFPVSLWNVLVAKHFEMTYTDIAFKQILN